VSDITRNRKKVKMLVSTLKKKQRAKLYDINSTVSRAGESLFQDFTSMVWQVLDDIPPVMAEATRISELVPNSHRSLLTDHGLEKIRGMLGKVEVLTDEVRKITGRPHSAALEATSEFRDSVEFYSGIRQELSDFREATKSSKKPIASRETYFSEELFKGIRPGLLDRESFIADQIREDVSQMLGFLSTRFDNGDFRKLSKSQLVQLKMNARVLQAHEIDQIFVIGLPYDNPSDILPTNLDSMLDHFAKDHCDDFVRAGSRKMAELINGKIDSLKGPVSIEATSDSGMNVKWKIKGEKGLRIEGRAIVTNETLLGQPDREDSNSMRGHRQYYVDFSRLEYRQGQEKIVIESPDDAYLKSLGELNRISPASKPETSRSVAGLSL
jgi:hypothetical protein